MFFYFHPELLRLPCWEDITFIRDHLIGRISDFDSEYLGSTPSPVMNFFGPRVMTNSAPTVERDEGYPKNPDLLTPFDIT